MALTYRHSERTLLFQIGEIIVSKKYIRFPGTAAASLQGVLAASSSEVFAKTPATEPYYVREGEEGPLLECAIAPQFRGKNFDVEWILYSKGAPR